MTDLKTALFAFWSQFGVPAYLIDCVPDGAVLPYITYTVTQPAFNGASLFTAYNWHRRAENGNVERSSMMDAIAAKIPARGTFLKVGSGYIVLRRNDADFQVDWQDNADDDIIAGRTSCVGYYYTL